MASGYTRVFSKVTGNTIQAADFNNEFQLIDDAFSEASGHKHDGSTNEGAYIPKISDTNNYTCVEIDSANAEIDFNINVSSAKVRQLVLTDGALLPSVDNDVDLGSTTFEFKNLYIDGVAYIDGVGETLNPSADGTIDLGSSSLRWHELFVRDFINLDGVAGFTTGLKLELDGDAIAYIQVFDGADPYLLLRKQTAGGGVAASQLYLTESGAIYLDCDVFSISTPDVPASAGATGIIGSIAFDTNYIYVCVATNTWKRAALSTW